jgi:hypothetical protein
MKSLRRSALVGTAALAMTAATVLTAAPAQAASTVSGCTVTQGLNAAGFNEVTSLCTQGSGTYRTVVFFGVTSLSNPFNVYYGNVAQVGQPSTFTFGPGNGVAFRAPYVGTQILS